jgi:hypothetical protein
MPVTPVTPKAAPGQFASPDITAAQVLSVISAVAAQVVAWGIMTQGTSAQLVSIAGIVLPAVWAVVDSVIRHGRATGSATK